MATYSISGAGTTGFPAGGANVRVISEVVDFSATTNAAADVFETLGIPAETTVLGAGINVITADSAGNSGTLALGDGGDADRFVAASTVAAVGQETAIFATTVPHLYGAADTIDLTVATGAINAVVRVWAIVADCTGGVEAAQTVTFA